MTDLDDVKPGTYGHDYGAGAGHGYGASYGYGSDHGHGTGSGYGDGSGYGAGSGYGSCYSYGSGDGCGYGSGRGDGSGFGSGDVHDHGYGDRKATTLPDEITSIEIVIARHGWIYAGPVERVGDQIVMRGAVNIRLWGCPLGKLAQDPEAHSLNGCETKYDIAGTVKMHSLAEVASLECNADKWLPFLERFALSKNNTPRKRKR